MSRERVGRAGTVVYDVQYDDGHLAGRAHLLPRVCGSYCELRGWARTR